MASFVINNTALRNNGDVALAAALTAALEQRGHRVSLATAHPEFAVNLQGISNICADVEGVRRPQFRRPIVAQLAALALLIAHPAYRRCDVIVGAPGGYLNSHYGDLGWRLAIYRWAAKLGKKTAIYAQSVDSLLPADAAVLAQASHALDLLLVRDQASAREALEIGVSPTRLLQAVDAIFLMDPRPSLDSVTSRSIVISVRDWPHGQGRRDDYLAMMARLATLSCEYGFHVRFLSTCQGIPSYIDDSKVARAVVDRMPKRFAINEVEVIDGAFSLSALREHISTAHVVIGTRLHMCLLALLASVPAFNISYEPKGRECYRYLGIPQASIDYYADSLKAESAYRNFFDERETIRATLPEIMARHHRQAHADLDEFLARLGVS